MGKSKYYGVQQLVEAASNVLASGVAPQEKKTVSELPDERTVRFYISQSLLPEAKKEGRQKVFTDLHLFALLAIKKLQSDGLPITIIRSLIENRSEEELRTLLGEQLTVFTDEASLRKHIQDNPDSISEEIVVLNEPEARAEFLEGRTKNKAQEYLESLLASRQKPSRSPVASPAHPRRSSPSPPPSPPLSTLFREENWRHFKIVPGVELHIEASYRGPKSENEKHSIADAIERILRSFAQR